MTLMKDTTDAAVSPTGDSAEVAPASRLRAQAVSLGYADRPVVEQLTVDVPTGKVTAIVGSNGCGKSTLLRGLSRLLKPSGGQILLDGKSIHESSTKDVARAVGLLPQSPVAPDGITVTELVSRGRHPHHGMFKQWSRADDDAVAEALEQTQTVDLAHREVDALSGGQRQRVWIAMVLAQQTDLLLLDEPTSYLDIAHAVEVLDLVTDLNHRGTTVVMVLHDLNLAARYADHVIAMSGGSIVREGDPHDVVTADVVEQVFGVPCQIVPDPVSATPMVVPVGRHRRG